MKRNVFISRQVKHLLVAAAGMSVIVGASVAVAAPVLSRPGDSIDEQMPLPKIGVEDRLPSSLNDESVLVRFDIVNFRLEAPEMMLNVKALEEILIAGMGRDKTLSDISQTVNDLTSYCRRNGYPAAAAYIPPQESTDGVVTLRIIPGRYNAIKLDNNSRLKTKAAEKLLASLQTGDIITTKTLETALYTISDITGARAVGVLSPGEGFGTSDLTVRLDDAKRNNTIVYVENYGSKSTGRYRLGVQETIYNASGNGDKVNAGILFSNKDLRNYYANYEMIVGHSGATVGLGIARMDYKVSGGALKDIDANGKALTVSVFGSAPIYRMTDRSLKLRYGFDYRDLEDDIGAFGLLGEKHSTSVYTGLTGFNRSRNSMLTYDLELRLGRLSPDSDYARLLSALNNTDGNYAKVEASASLVKRIGNSTDILLKASGQKASRNLDSSEDFSLGGQNSVRAYPQGEGSGDEGYVATAELRYHTQIPGLILTTFYDTGRVRFTKSGSFRENYIGLSGWGLGLAYNDPRGWFTRLDYARRIGDDESLSEAAKARNRFWFLMGNIW